MKLVVSAPGRACLFGEHQDYLGLPVVPCALDMRMVVEGETRTDGVFRIADVKHGVSGKFSLDDLDYRNEDFDFLRAVVRVMLGDGMDSIAGADVEMRSEVPISSGLSSSAAMLVAWAKFLNDGFDLGYEPLSLAMVCYRAEHDELGIPCGVMDQISSSFGGITHIDCSDPPVVRRLNADIGDLVIGDTLIHKRTMDVHGTRTREMTRAIEQLSNQLGERVDLAEVSWSDVEKCLPEMDGVSTMRLRAALNNRDITRSAVEIFESGSPDLPELGRLLLRHHAYLRDDYQVSHPMLDKLIAAGLSAGALGGKLTGAGLGGCVVLLAPYCQDEVAEAIRGAGGRPYMASVDEGARREI
jgi:galactokinase